RSIQDPRDRLATILVAPLMTCSARLPVYALLIGAFIPAGKIGIFNQQGLVLFGLYVAGILSALVMSWVMKKWRRDKSEHPLMLELPSYRIPHPRDLAVGLYERGMIFLKRVGGIILALTILLWFLLSFPGAPADATMPAIDYSYAGQIGHAMTAIFAPLGFNWQICIALIPGLAAREVAVSSLATVYALSAADDDAAISALSPVVADGWSLATGLALLVWFIYAPMCISTLATIKRETNSWKTMGFSAFYLFAAAFVAALITYQVTVALGGG
ncbi:ferrous iron transporter B, partial [Stenotrophomonas sp. HMWF022]